MEWTQARAIIASKIKVGTDVNTARSTYRFVRKTNAAMCRYGYNNELGFIVPVGKTACVGIPWSMLETCFQGLAGATGYGGSWFRQHFALQAKDRGCHVHVVGQLFVKAGLAKQRDNSYFSIDD